MAAIGQDLVENYKNFVSDNPETATNIESALRIFSYIYPGIFVPSFKLLEFESNEKIE